jgi:predicted signal transduction protein with EAL and GGDEF domain
MVARLGGDEFACCWARVRDESAAREIAERVRFALDEPIDLERTLIDVEASTGIALSPVHGDDFEQLLQRADVAMYLAKAERTGVEVYAAERDKHSPERLGLLGSLRRGIDAHELELHYQPKIALSDGAIRGVEALVRWRHPSRGLVMPDDFVPLAEESGLMQRLTEAVIEISWRRPRRGGVPAWPFRSPSTSRCATCSTRPSPVRIGALLQRHGLPARRSASRSPSGS